MSRNSMPVGDHHTLVFGHDRPFNTLFAALYDERDPTSKDPAWEGEERPLKAFGYHPAEQGSTPPDTEYGVYPADIGDFDRALTEWGIDGVTRERCGRMLAQTEDE